MFGFDPTTTTFLIYIVAMILIGLIAYRVTNNLSDYILGGRRLGSFVTALSAGASDMSGWLLMGLPGAVYAGGLIEAWLAVGLTIGAYLNWKLVAGRLRAHTEYSGDALTLPEYFHNRFGDKTKLIKILSAFIFLLFCGCYYSLYLYWRLFSCELDGHDPSVANGLCIIADATFCYIKHW